ncbi:AraC family transcriptional regulator [Intestinimonas sp. HCP28S3_D6]|uniref:helix-turn-helix transcriptional regulator n=1 Tax=Intestinimonas sp. HCP28S3_D6 TaxID=3438942 RepID=UPI003F8CAAFE
MAAVCDIVHGGEHRPALSAELVPVSVQQMLSDALRDRCQSEIVLGVSSILIATAWERDPVESLMRILGEVCTECERILGVTLAVGIGRPCQKLEELCRSCGEARAALEYRAVVGMGKPIYIQDMERLDRTVPEGDSHREQQLLSVIKFGSQEQIAAMVDKLLAEGDGEWSDQSRAIGMLGTLLPVIQRCRLGEEAMLGPRGTWLALLAEDTPMEELRAWLLSVCLNMSGCMDQRRVSTAKRLVEEAERYIRENYPDSGLSVDRICDHLHISQSYFSTIFKQETGRSYVQYLTDVRMEHAVELLRTTDDKTYMVAEKVGYDEPNYFSYVFKKRFGVSPSQFRK